MTRTFVVVSVLLFVGCAPSARPYGKSSSTYRELSAAAKKAKCFGPARSLSTEESDFCERVLAEEQAKQSKKK